VVGGVLIEYKILYRVKDSIALGGWCMRYGRIGWRRERARGEYRFSCLMKQKKKS
jgi:hypothetical protein